MLSCLSCLFLSAGDARGTAWRHPDDIPTTARPQRRSAAPFSLIPHQHSPSTFPIKFPIVSRDCLSLMWIFSAVCADAILSDSLDQGNHYLGLALISQPCEACNDLKRTLTCADPGTNVRNDGRSCLCEEASCQRSCIIYCINISSQVEKF